MKAASPKGTYKPAVRDRPTIIAAHKTGFCPCRQNTELRCERRLKEWKISHMDIVRNAMVIPCSDTPEGSEKTPVSKKLPTQ